MHRIDSIDDPRIAPYRNLRDRTLRGESLFVTEGRVLTLRLLEGPFEAESVLVADEYAEEFARRTGDRVPLYVAPEPLLLEIVGFPFHRGVLGAGRRKAPLRPDELLARFDLAARLRLVVLPEVTKPENLGLVFRSAAAFGIDAVLLGQWSCDPLSRRALRVSMGGSLQAPWTRSDDILADLATLRSRWRVELAAAVLDPGAEPLAEVRWPDRAAVLLGNETEGLRDRLLWLADRRVTIPMRPGVDSLNLGVAAGVFLYAMSR